MGTAVVGSGRARWRCTVPARLAVRTFWLEDGQLHVGVGGGVTWGSTPEEETELEVVAAAAATGRDA